MSVSEFARISTWLNLSLLLNVILILGVALLYHRKSKLRMAEPRVKGIHHVLPELNPREAHLVELILSRATTERIADELHISPDSVKKSKYRLKKKLNLPSSQSLEEHLREIVHQFPWINKPCPPFVYLNSPTFKLDRVRFALEPKPKCLCKKFQSL